MTPQRRTDAAPAGLAGSGAGLPARLTLWGVVALLVLAVAWELWLAPLRPGGSLLVLKALPLLLVVRGLARGRRRSFQVTSMLVLLYLAEGVVRGMTDPQPAATLGWIEFALATAVFAAVLAHVRAENRSASALASTPAAPAPRSP